MGLVRVRMWPCYFTQVCRFGFFFPTDAFVNGWSHSAFLCSSDREGISLSLGLSVLHLAGGLSMRWRIGLHLISFPEPRDAGSGQQWERRLWQHDDVSMTFHMLFCGSFICCFLCVMTHRKNKHCDKYIVLNLSLSVPKGIGVQTFGHFILVYFAVPVIATLVWSSARIPVMRNAGSVEAYTQCDSMYVWLLDCIQREYRKSHCQGYGFDSHFPR